MKALYALLLVAALAACGSTAQPSGQAGGGGGGVAADQGLSAATGPVSSATGGGAGSPPVTGGESGTAGSFPNASGSPGGLAPGSPAALPGTTGSGPAVSGAASTGPVTVGFVTTAVSNAASAGFNTSSVSSYTESQIEKALVAAVNASGGLAGHHVNAVYAATDTAGSSWDTEFAAACATFTQDNHVAAVLGYVFDHLDSFETCLAQKGVPHISTTFNVPDLKTIAKYPLLVELATPTIDQRGVAKINAGLAMGVLTPSSRIGVVLDSCPGTGEAWNNVVLPYIKSKNLNVVTTFSVGCPNGSGAADAAAGQAGSLILQLRAARVDRLMFDSVSEGPAMFLIAATGDPQGYYPQYILSSLGQTALLTGMIPADQATHVYGVGWLPVEDVVQPQWPTPPAPVNRCLSLLKSQGIVVTKVADQANAFSSCDALFLYEKALQHDGGSTNGQAVVNAIEGLGSSYVGVEALNGATMFSPTRRVGPILGRTFSYSKACSCFVYGSTTIPIS